MRKKMFLGIVFTTIAIGVNAQSNPQIQNKKGIDLMPVQGDFAIGFNALPALNFVGNLFGYVDNNGSLGANKFVSSFANNTLFGKYMLTNNTAIRGHLRVAMDNSTFQNQVDDDGQVDSEFKVVDTYKYNAALYNIGVGYEWRRGKTRVRGIYGGEIFYQYGSGLKQEYTYGNPIQEGNYMPTTTIWNVDGSRFISSANERLVSVEGGSSNGIGLRAFAGVEYFIAPKICIGTEFGWGGSYRMSSDRIAKWETWDFEDGTKTKITEEKILSSSSFSLDTDNFNGALYFMFYF